jgi:hypothetical protein
MVSEQGVSRVSELENILGEILDAYGDLEINAEGEEAIDLLERARVVLDGELDRGLEDEDGEAY